jgi:hypothetical protein
MMEHRPLAAGVGVTTSEINGLADLKRHFWPNEPNFI